MKLIMQFFSAFSIVAAVVQWCIRQIL